MKKRFLSLLFSTLICFVGFSELSAQVLEKSGVQNYLWTGMGLPTGTPNSSERAGFRWYGFIDTIQARVDISKFTIDGMLAWGALTEWTNNSISEFTFVNTASKPEHFAHQAGKINADAGRRSNAYNQGDSSYGNDSYYLNFLWHPFEGFDVGIGTRLEWDVGPAPSYGAYTWEYRSHVHQGDLRDGNPGSVPVAGYTKYANTYAQKAISVRYKYKNIIEAGIAIPSGFNTGHPFTNVGIAVTPIDFITAAFAYESLFMNDSNLYTGATLRFAKGFILDAYLAFNGLGANYSTNGKFGTGAAITFGIPGQNLSFRPEVGFTFYSNKNYTMAFFTGAKVNFDFASRCHLGCWVSFAWGADDVRWHENKNLPQNDWFGGFIFNIRPEFEFEINKNHSLAVSTEFQSLTNYKKDVVDSMLFGFYWRFKTN